MIAFYFLSVVCRGLTVLLAAFFLKRGNYKLGWKELLVMTYGGLKGALGLALALIVSNTPIFSDGGERQRTGELILFFMAGTATLSILVQGTTTKFLVKKIKMIKPNPARAKVFRALLRELDEHTKESYDDIKEEHPAALCDWDNLKELADLKEDLEKAKLAKKKELEECQQEH